MTTPIQPAAPIPSGYSLTIVGGQGYPISIPFQFITELCHYTTSPVDHFAYANKAFKIRLADYDLPSTEAMLKMISDAAFNAIRSDPDNPSIPTQRVVTRYLGSGYCLTIMEFFHRLWPCVSVEESWSIDIEAILTCPNLDATGGALWWDQTDADTGPAHAGEVQIDTAPGSIAGDPRCMGHLTKLKTAHISWRRIWTTNPVCLYSAIDNCVNGSTYRLGPTGNFTCAANTLYYAGQSNIKYMGGTWFSDTNMLYRPYGWWTERWPRNSDGTLKTSVTGLGDVRIQLYNFGDFSIVTPPDA